MRTSRRWRCALGSGNGQRIGLRQPLPRQRGSIGRDRPCRAQPCRGTDRSAWRHRQFALLDQGRTLRDHRRQGRARCCNPRGGRGGRRPRCRGRLVDHGIDDRGVVDVVEDDVVRRCRNIDRRPDEHRNRHEHRARQDEKPDGCDRRRQHDEIRRWRRQVVHRRRRWRHKVEIGIVEREDGPVDIDLFVGRRRWHVVIQHRE